MNVREAQEEFGLSVYAIYLAMRRREIRVIQPGGKGRYYYLADELRALAERLGLVPTHDGPGGKSKMGWAA